MLILFSNDHCVAQNVNLRSFGSKARFCSQENPCEICSGQSGIGTCVPSQYFDFSLSIIQPRLHIHHLHAALTRRIKGRSLESFKKAMLFENRGALDKKLLLLRIWRVTYYSIFLFFYVDHIFLKKVDWM